MADHKLLRLSATLVLIGEVVLLFITLVLHPGGGPTEEAIFANYAASGAWDQYISLNAKKGKRRQESSKSGILPEREKTRSFRCTDYARWMSMTRCVNR